ncbi:MAG: BolA family protein [Pseudomonadota bacterium]
MSPEQRAQALRERLQALSPLHLEITDESHQHVGHVGARDGKGHFAVNVVSEQFLNKNRLQRHRLIYDIVGDLMQTDIHALRIQALTSQEHNQ